jgi:hypothetical protein
MAIIGKLTALQVERQKRPGVYGDGGGLYLQITARREIVLSNSLGAQS